MVDWQSWKNTDPRYFPPWEVSDKMPKFNQRLYWEDACMFIFNMYPPSVKGDNCPYNILGSSMCEEYTEARTSCGEYLRTLGNISMQSIVAGAETSKIVLPNNFPKQPQLNGDDQIRYDIVRKIMSGNRNIEQRKVGLFVPIARLILNEKAEPLARVICRRWNVSAEHHRSIAYVFLQLAKGETPTLPRSNHGIQRYLNPTPLDSNDELLIEPKYLLLAMESTENNDDEDCSQWRYDELDYDSNDWGASEPNAPLNPGALENPSFEDILQAPPDDTYPNSNRPHKDQIDIVLEYFDDDDQFAT